MHEPIADRAAEALGQAGLFGGGRVVAASPLTGGKASAVYKVSLSTGQTIVLKTADARVIETEAIWLRGWSEIGVATPAVYAYGLLADSTPYLLMELIDGPSVQSDIDAGRLPDQETMQQLGRVLATMHSIRGSGFGSAGYDHLDGAATGRFQTLREQLASEALPQGLAFAREIGAISDADLAAVERAVNVLNEHAQVTGPRRTHGDFRTGNILHSRGRLVVIDPWPALTHPYVCLAYALLLPELFAEARPVNLLAGYTEISPVDPRALDAALLIRAGIMFNSFGRRRDNIDGRSLPPLFARLREPFS